MEEAHEAIRQGCCASFSVDLALLPTTNGKHNSNAAAATAVAAAASGPVRSPTTVSARHAGGVREEGGEVVAVVAEVRDCSSSATSGGKTGGKAVPGAAWLDDVAAAVRSAVTAQHGVTPAVVVLIPAHAVRDAKKNQGSEFFRSAHGVLKYHTDALNP